MFPHPGLLPLQLVRRIYKGIPLQLRGEVWCLLLDIPKIKEEKKDFYEVRKRDLKSYCMSFTGPKTFVFILHILCTLDSAAQ